MQKSFLALAVDNDRTNTTTWNCKCMSNSQCSSPKVTNVPIMFALENAH